MSWECHLSHNTAFMAATFPVNGSPTRLASTAAVITVSIHNSSCYCKEWKMLQGRHVCCGCFFPSICMSEVSAEKKKIVHKKNLLIPVILILHTHWPKLCIVCCEKGKPWQIEFPCCLAHGQWISCSSRYLVKEPQCRQNFWWRRLCLVSPFHFTHLRQKKNQTRMNQHK